jgi:2-methylaconitate cis-trans-isomerase PrpF
MQKVHHAYALTAAICTAAAAKLQGTIVHEVFKDRGENSVVIGHPKGVIVPLVKVDQGKVKEVVIARTARLLLRGETYVQY